MEILRYECQHVGGEVFGTRLFRAPLAEGMKLSFNGRAFRVVTVWPPDFWWEVTVVLEDE